MSPRLDTIHGFAKSRKHKAGFTSVVAVIILLGLVAVMGSVALIWGNNFNVEKQKLGDYYTTNANKIKERLIIEDLWLSKKPTGVTSTAEANMAVVVIRNVGDIAITVKDVKINVLNATGGAVCTLSCEVGTSFQNTVRAPFNPTISTGLISSGQTLMVIVDKLDWDHVNSKSLEVFITTDRGSIIWRVYDWKQNVATVPTCNGYPVTIMATLPALPEDGNDLFGTDEDDVIHGFGGVDVIRGKGGNDIICGGDGNDSIWGEAGDDTIFGDNDNDLTLDGGSGNDKVDGGSGTEVVCVAEIVVNCNP